jgi:hypothetical protein
MFNTLLKIYLISSSILFCNNLISKTCDMRAFVDIINQHILLPNRGLHADAEKGSADPYWNRLSAILHAVPVDDLLPIFTPPNGMSLKQFYDSLFWKIKSGEITADSKLERLIIELRDFVSEFGDKLNNPNNLGFQIISTLD